MTKGRNPYTTRQKQPEWDGSEVPQIVSGVDGTVTVLGADGKASRYKNEKSYKIAESKNRMAEHLYKTSQTVKRNINGFRMPPLKRSGSVSNTKENGSHKELTLAPAKESAHIKHRRQRFGGKLPKMPSFSKNSSKSETKTTVVDDRRRSNHTSLSIHY
jgi:hypothetical protein